MEYPLKNTKAINVTGRKNFKYTPAAATDITATWRRARREMELQAEKEKAERENVVAKRKLAPR